MQPEQSVPEADVHATSESDDRELSTAELELIHSLVSRLGEVRAARTLNVPRSTLARACARFGMRRGTCLLIRQRLRSIGSSAELVA